jgi:hypothetical protein
VGSISLLNEASNSTPTTDIDISGSERVVRKKGTRMLIRQLAERIEACPELIEADKILWNDECILDIIDEVIVEGNVE